MANNIEWGHASALPALLDQQDVLDLTQDENETAGTYGLSIGEDGSMLLYGTLDEIDAWLRAAQALVDAVRPVPTAITITVVLDIAPSEDPRDALGTYLVENGVPDPVTVDPMH